MAPAQAAPAHRAKATRESTAQWGCASSHTCRHFGLPEFMVPASQQTSRRAASSACAPLTATCSALPTAAVPPSTSLGAAEHRLSASRALQSEAGFGRPQPFEAPLPEDASASRVERQRVHPVALQADLGTGSAHGSASPPTPTFRATLALHKPGLAPSPGSLEDLGSSSTSARVSRTLRPSGPARPGTVHPAALSETTAACRENDSLPSTPAAMSPHAPGRRGTSAPCGLAPDTAALNCYRTFSCEHGLAHRLALSNTAGHRAATLDSSLLILCCRRIETVRA